MRHDSGLHVLASPGAPEAAEAVTPAHIGQVLTTLLGGYDMIVIDAGSSLDERTLMVFEAAEAVILPVTPEIAALKAVHALFEYLSEVGSVGLKTTYVLNNVFAREILKPRDVESFLGTKMSAELPYDPFLYLKASNEGVPLVTGAPRSTPSERLVRPQRHGVRRGGGSHRGLDRRAQVRPVPASPLGLRAASARRSRRLGSPGRS